MSPQGIGLNSFNVFITSRLFSAVIAGWHFQIIRSGLPATHWGHWRDTEEGLHVQALGLWVTLEKN